jgi:Fuc2NAc and GlcNAc transferase
MISAFLLVSFVIGSVGAWIMAKFGKKMGMIDQPGERSSHRVPVPKGGGIGILVAFILCSFMWDIPWSFWIPACIVSLTSLLADCRDLSFKIRLAVQAGSAAIFIVLAMSRIFPFDKPGGTPVLIFAIGVLFISATANIYNFMDGIDGIAGVSGAIAFTFLGIFGLAEGRPFSWSMLAFGIAAACLGFLPLNIPKARVFMGDVGSVLLGFIFASFIVWFSRSVLDVLVLASILFPFYADEFNTGFVRIKDGEKLTKAHRRHIYQILANQRGLPHSRVTLYYGIIQILAGILIWIMMRQGLLAITVLLFILSGVSFMGGLSIRRHWEATR